MSIVLAMLAFAVTSCNDNEPSAGVNDNGSTKKEAKDESKIKYPIEVPFTEIELASWGSRDCGRCAGPGFNYDERLIVVDNDEALRNYIAYYQTRMIGDSGDSVACCPEIDFSKQTFLLASGEADEITRGIFTTLQQLSANKYRLGIEVFKDSMRPAPVTWGNSWCVALIIDKLSRESDVELNVTYKES